MTNEIEPKSEANPTSKELVPEGMGLNEKESKSKNWRDFLRGKIINIRGRVFLITTKKKRRKMKVKSNGGL